MNDGVLVPGVTALLWAIGGFTVVLAVVTVAFLLRDIDRRRDTREIAKRLHDLQELAAHHRDSAVRESASIRALLTARAEADRERQHRLLLELWDQVRELTRMVGTMRRHDDLVATPESADDTWDPYAFSDLENDVEREHIQPSRKADAPATELEADIAKADLELLRRIEQEEEDAEDD